MKKLIILFLLLSGCKSFKKATEIDKTTTETNIERKQTIKAGDTVTIQIPNIRYKDTTITKVNYDTKTIATVRYDDNGNQTFDCISTEIKELTETINKMVKNDIESKEVKEKEFNPQYFIYSIVILALVVLGGFAFLYTKIR